MSERYASWQAVGVIDVAAIAQAAGLEFSGEAPTSEQLDVTIVRIGVALCVLSNAGGLSLRQTLDNLTGFWGQIEAQQGTEGAA